METESRRNPARSHPTMMKLARLLGGFALFALHFSLASAASVRDFGARGDGVTDDTDAIMTAIRQAADGVVEFPRGDYRLTRTIEIRLHETGRLGLAGRGGSARVVMAGEGPAFRFIGSKERGSAAPVDVKPVTWEKERMPLIDGLEIVGTNPKADGIELRYTMQPVFRSLLIRDLRYGIHFTAYNRNVLITGCHVYHCGIGIYFDAVNLHQAIISANHISYCRQAGIKTSGGEIRNLQITGNDIEYNYDLDGTASADIWVDSSQGGSLCEGTITGNTIQAISSPGGANVRFVGPGGDAQQNQHWTITGNHISNQEINIHLVNARGFTITGNTLLRGLQGGVQISDSRNIVVSANVFDPYPSDFRTARYSYSQMRGGIAVVRSRNVLLSNNLINDAASGSPEAGGAMSVSDSREITIAGGQIVNPKFRGIHVARSANVRVTDCVVSEDESVARMLAAIELTDACPGTVVRNNAVSRGKQGDIVNRASGAVVEANAGVAAAAPPP